jgi:hypothetical protein
VDHGRLLDIAVIENTAAAEVALDPIRARLLAELAQPKSATMLGQTFGLPRQKVNYHLKALEPARAGRARRRTPQGQRQRTHGCALRRLRM